jgi:hypothetical protein
MPLTFGANILNEGQFASVVCIVTQGDEPLSITWSLQGEVVSSEPGLTTSTLGARTSMLTIQSVGHRHSGLYTCTASNFAGSQSETVELKVNGEARVCWSGNEKGRKKASLFMFDPFSKSDKFQSNQKYSH